MTAPANTYAMRDHTITISDASSHSVTFTAEAESKRAALLTAMTEAQQGLQALVNTDEWTITIT